MRSPVVATTVTVLALALAGCSSGGSPPTGDQDGGSSMASTWWAPEVGAPWQWQLSGEIDTTVDVPVFDIDMDAPEAAVSALRQRGVRLVCYFSAGSWEPWRADADQFPGSVRGDAMSGWPDEAWLDVRQLDTLLPLMDARMAACRERGFDAVEPDNVDGYANDSGFPLTAEDQLAYNRAIADLAHAHGLGVALKNDPEQVRALQPSFDFAVVEECVRYSECDAYRPFIENGKAVLHVEYRGALERICRQTQPLGFSSMLKELDLGAWRSACGG